MDYCFSTAPSRVVLKVNDEEKFSTSRSLGNGADHPLGLEGEKWPEARVYINSQSGWLVRGPEGAR